MDEAPYDVVQIGYGPVSQCLALMLGRQKRRVAVCERWETRYPLPRAVCIDHEVYRILSALGLGDVLPTISHRGPLYQWFNAAWEELLVIDWSADAISGGAEVNFVHQPTLEEALDRAVAAQPTVATFFGWEAVEVRQDDRLAHVRLRHAETGEEQILSARYIVGCDGANSLVQRTIGGGKEDRGFEADWLVIDVLLKGDETIDRLGIPAAAQYCDPVRPTTIVPAGIRDGRTFRRWEFMRLPGEDVQDLEREERVWQLLEPWVTPDDVELVRHKVYNFRSLLAARWRDRRLLVAGDAAHVMPPFMGQGMCSGLRDAWNLAWRLDFVLDDLAADRLIDGYQPERMPHVDQLIDLSIYLGKMICIPDPAAAAERDAAFLTGTAEPPPPFPHLIDGLLHRDRSGALTPGAGLLSPHVTIVADTVERRLDDHTGGRFVVLALDVELEALLPEPARLALASIGTSLVTLSKDGASGRVRDVDGRLDRFLIDNGWRAIVVRPDYYIYGAAAAVEQLPSLIEDLLADLTRHGFGAMPVAAALDDQGRQKAAVS